MQDLEDEIAGLETRLGNLKSEMLSLEKAVGKKNVEIAEAEGLIKKYEDQQKNVRITGSMILCQKRSNTRSLR